MRVYLVRLNKSGFTLIELLIVVAIIAILAAIAVPNFLEAQTRSKVSRCKNDLRTQSVAMEAYMVDNNTYTRDSDSSLDVASSNNSKPFGKKANGVVQLTTPVAYMSSILTDPFGVAPKIQSNVAGGMAIGYRIGSGSWSYEEAGYEDNQNSFEIFQSLGSRGSFVLIGVGPDQARCRVGYKAFPYQPKLSGSEGPDPTNWTAPVKGGQPGCYTEYDSTNGSSSIGDIYRFGGSWREGRFCLNGAVVGAETSFSTLTW